MFFLIAYISSVVLINFAFSTAPHLDVIWSAWGGLVFILRDMVQTRFGHGAIIAMLAALVLSYITSDLHCPGQCHGVCGVRVHRLAGVQHHQAPAA